MLQKKVSKTKICTYHLNGKCTRASKCQFAHSKDELRSPPDLYKTRLCAAHSSSEGCSKGDACRFAHGETELRWTPDVYKISRCPYYIENVNSSCLMKDACRWAHGEADLRPGPDYGTSMKSCKAFKRKVTGLSNLHDRSLPPRTSTAKISNTVNGSPQKLKHFSQASKTPHISRPQVAATRHVDPRDSVTPIASEAQEAFFKPKVQTTHYGKCQEVLSSNTFPINFSSATPQHQVIFLSETEGNLHNRRIFNEKKQVPSVKGCLEGVAQESFPQLNQTFLPNHSWSRVTETCLDKSISDFDDNNRVLNKLMPDPLCTMLASKNFKDKNISWGCSEAVCSLSLKYSKSYHCELHHFSDGESTESSCFFSPSISRSTNFNTLSDSPSSEMLCGYAKKLNSFNDSFVSRFIDSGMVLRKSRCNSSWTTYKRVSSGFPMISRCASFDGDDLFSLSDDLGYESDQHFLNFPVRQTSSTDADSFFNESQEFNENVQKSLPCRDS